MPGPAPKPDADRRRRNAPTFKWHILPAAGRSGPPPALPTLREWSEPLLAEWASWWATPQATAWDQSGKSLLRWALMTDRVMTELEPPTALHAQILAIEDRHGFSPAAMLKLRWVIDDLEPAAVKPKGRSVSGDPPVGSGLGQLLVLRGGAAQPAPVKRTAARKAPAKKPAAKKVGARPRAKKAPPS